MALTVEARQARALYMREWRKRNPDKQRQYTEAKWERKGQELKAKREAACNDTP